MVNLDDRRCIEVELRLNSAKTQLAKQVRDTKPKHCRYLFQTNTTCVVPLKLNSLEPLLTAAMTEVNHGNAHACTNLTQLSANDWSSF